MSSCHFAPLIQSAWVLSHTHFCFPRSADIPTRQRYVRLVESVKDNGGNVRIFSSLHVSGERKWGKKGEGGWESVCVSGFVRVREREREMREFNYDSTLPTHATELGQLSGVASILRFPLPEPDDSDDSDQDD